MSWDINSYSKLYHELGHNSYSKLYYELGYQQL